MKAFVTTKGQVTIPKELREKYGIRPGAQVDFTETPEGIRMRKVVDRNKGRSVLGCLSRELQGRKVEELLDEVRGPVAWPRGEAAGEEQP